MRLTQEDYLECLANGMSFDEMAIEFGWTRQQIKQFGEGFFDRAFEERGKSIGSQIREKFMTY